MIQSPYLNGQWQNAQTYAPWATPDGAHGTNSNPSFGGQGGRTELGANPFDPSQAWNFAMNWGPWDFKGGSKRGSPNFYAPSYQGQMFTPDEGIPNWYTNSDTSDDWMGASYQGMQSNYARSNPNTPMNANMSGQNPGPMPQPNAYGEAYQPMAIGSYQSQYQPNYAAMSGLSPQALGGYGSYAGASGAQPYVPGQY
jgi:hypothetical protein